LCWQNIFSQKDSLVVTKKHIVSKVLIPSALILSGTLLTSTKTEKTWQTKIRNKVGNNFSFTADNYLQYVPFAEVYFGDVIGLKAKNHWFDQTKNIFISGLITGIVVQSVKRITGKTRPDGSHHSFPSGHTSTAFTGATALYCEFKDTHPIYAYSGYAFATATAGLRVMNNRHWVSDVLAGAGISMLITNAVYYFEPLKNWNPFKNSKKRNITFYPLINYDEATFVASYRF